MMDIWIIYRSIDMHMKQKSSITLEMNTTIAGYIKLKIKLNQVGLLYRPYIV